MERIKKLLFRTGIPFLSMIVLVSGTIIMFALLMLAPTLEEQINKKDKLIGENRAVISELQDKNSQIRSDKIELMAKLFKKNNNIKLKKDTYPQDTTESLVEWVNTKMWMPYKLGGKWGGNIDCSGLFGAYAHYQIGLINYNTLINHYSAQNIWERNTEVQLEDISYGDLMYIMELKGMSHVAMVVWYSKWEITTLESNPIWGVWEYKYRLLDSPYGKFIERNWNVWDFKFSKNELLTNRKYVWEFLISSYIPGNWDQINCWGGGCAHTASWLPLKDEYAWKIVACPCEYWIWRKDCWMEYRPKQKLYIEWHGVVECSDRWGLITMKWEENSRWNITSINRLDLFAGIGTPKIKRWQDTRKVYLVN